MKTFSIITLAAALSVGAAERRVTTSTTTTSTTADGTKVIVSMEKDGKIQTRTFQVPSATVPVQVQQLNQTEKVAHLGVALTEPSADLARHLGLKGGAGVLAAQVLPGSPAAKAGLKAHDLLTKIDDQILFNIEQTVALIRSLKPGQEVTVTYYRGGGKKTAKVSLVEKEMPILSASPPAFPKQLQIYTNTLPRLTNRVVFSPMVETPLLISTNHPYVQFSKEYFDQIRAAYEQAAAAAATNPFMGRKTVLINRSGNNTLVRELSEVHAKVKQAVERSLKQSDVSAADRKRILEDLERFLKDEDQD